MNKVLESSATAWLSCGTHCLKDYVAHFYLLFCSFVAYPIAGWRLCDQRRLRRCWPAENRKWRHLHAHFFQLVTQTTCDVLVCFHFILSSAHPHHIFSYLGYRFVKYLAPLHSCVLWWHSLFPSNHLCPVAFLFNWIGFFLSFCLTTSAAGRYGAISGFGLSLIKWILIVRVWGYTREKRHYAAHIQTLKMWFYICTNNSKTPNTTLAF